MRLAIISHKLCWKSRDGAADYFTDGGFPVQIRAISELFDSSTLTVPCVSGEHPAGLAKLAGHNTRVTELSDLKGTGLRRKMNFPFWLSRNVGRLWSEIYAADAVHALIPGDVGTIGMLMAMILRKRLIVRHCGNWHSPRTFAERVWKWSFETFAGGRNVMLATGGSENPPSEKNPNIRWIFSTSLSENDISELHPHEFPARPFRIVTASRLEPNKGTDVAIEGFSKFLALHPDATLDVIGDGSLRYGLERMAMDLGIAERTVFHGRLEREAVITVMRNADIFSYPTSASEGFPKVVLEAMACGLPVITTRVSVLPKLISGGCGILLDTGSPASLAAAMEEIAANPDLYESMSRLAVMTARQYTLENWRDTIGGILLDSWNVRHLSADTDPQKA